MRPLRPLRPLLAAAALLPAGLAAAPAFQTIDMLAIGVGNASMAGVGNLTPGAFPFGIPTSLGNVPFIVTQLNNQVWAADTASPGNNAVVVQNFTMPVNDIYGFYTVANTYWGLPGLSVIDYTFNFTDATSYTYTLTNGVDIRDFNSATLMFANTVNGTTAVNVYDDPVTSTVLDRQFIDLDAAGHGGKDLASFTVTDRGGSGTSRIFLVAATAQTGEAGQVPVDVITTSVDQNSPLVAGATSTFMGGTFAPVIDWLLGDVTVLAGSTGTIDTGGVLAGGSVQVNGSLAIGTGSTMTFAGTRAVDVIGGTSGAGQLLVTGGNHTVRGISAHTGGTLVSGGSLTAFTATSLPATGNVVTAGGSIILPNSGLGDGAVRNYAQSFSIVGTGTAAGPGAGAALVLGTAASSDSMSLNGTLTLTGNATVRFEGIDGEQRIAGAVNGDVAGRVLTVEVTPSARGSITSAVGGVNAVSLVKTGDGTLYMDAGSSLSSGIAVQRGLVAVFEAGTLAAAGNTVAKGAVLSFQNHGLNPLVISQAITTGSGGLGLNAVVGLIDAGGGGVRFDGDLTIVGRTSIDVISGSNSFTGSVSGGAGNVLIVTVTGGGTFTLNNGAVNVFGQVEKTGADRFVIASGTGVAAPVDVLAGTLSVNGTVTGDIAVSGNARLGGSGVITGNVTVAANGVFAPGNSPGITTVAAGNVTLNPLSIFEAELGGATAGNGDGFHDQLLVQAGTVTIGANTVLQAVQWAQPALFTPVRGDVMTVIRASGGITGTFGDLVNQNYATWLIYDNNQSPAHTEGRLFGTGLLRAQTFADYSVTHAALLQRIWDASVTESVSSAAGGNPAGFIRSDTGTGFAALTVLSAPTIDDAVALLGPGAHLAADDYVQTVMRSVQDADRNAVAVYGEGPWSLSVGYARADHRYVAAPQASLDHSLASDTAFASVTRQVGAWAVGGFFGSNTGSTDYSAGNAEYSGVLGGLSASGRVPGRMPLSLRLSAVWTDLSMDVSRNTSAASDVGVSGMGAQAWGELEAWKSARWSVSPAFGLTYGRSKVDGFTETGGAALNVDPFDADSLRGFAGVTLRAQATQAAELSLTAGYEHEFGQDPRRAHATFVDMPAGGIYPSAAEATYDAPVDEPGSLLVMAGLGWRLPAAMTLRAGVEYRADGDREDSLRFNLSLGRRF